MKRQSLCKYLVSLLICLIAVGAIFWTIARPYRVASGCMEPAVKTGNYIFLNRILPLLRSYKVGDIVLFPYEEAVWIARIVALAGDTIQLSEGVISLNGAPLQDAVQRNWSDWKFGTYAITEPYTVPADHVYVLSDDLSAHHDDSRVFGPAAKKSILGIVW